MRIHERGAETEINEEILQRNMPNGVQESASKEVLVEDPQQGRPVHEAESDQNLECQRTFEAPVRA